MSGVPGGPRLLGPADGDLMGDPSGVQDRFMIGAADTQGRFSVVEHILAPRSLAAPMHHHRDEDEYSYVLEGEVGAVLDGHEVVAKPGDMLFKPRGQWHTFWNAGDATARILEIISPAGLEELFRQLDSLDDSPDPEAMAEMAAAYGCEVDFEATFALLGSHDLSF